jgi:hypothetical protein
VVKTPHPAQALFNMRDVMTKARILNQPYYIKIPPLEFGAAMPRAFQGAPGTGGLAWPAARHWREELHSFDWGLGQKTYSQFCGPPLPVPARWCSARVNTRLQNLAGPDLWRLGRCGSCSVPGATAVVKSKRTLGHTSSFL